MKQTLAVQNRNLGIASAVAILFIWSGFIVFSRAGVKTSLTVADLTALRFLVAGAMTLPFAMRWWPGHLPLPVQIVIAVSGPGAIYSMLLFFGLHEASAAYAGVFTNGSIPFFTILLMVVFAGVLPGATQLLGLAVIVAGAVLLGASGMRGGGLNIALGISLFLTASALLSVYIFGLRFWRITPRQALALVNIPNAVVFLPIWIVVLPSGLAETPISIVLFHALFQGLGPGFVAVILFALAATHLGPTATAGFSAAVPATASLLAIPVLGEIPSTLEWIGIGTVTVGLLLLVRKQD